MNSISSEYVPSAEDVQHLSRLIHGIRIAMMTTVCRDGSLRSRPMATLDVPFDGALWFFTHADAPKVGEVEDEGQINICYADADENRYVSISGRASLTQDHQKIEELWRPELTAWFPGGLQNPQLALLRIDADKWEFWDTQSGQMVQQQGVLRVSENEVIPVPEERVPGDMTSPWVAQDVGVSKARKSRLPDT